MGIVIEEEEFYEAAKEGEEIWVDLEGGKVGVGGTEWGVKVSGMEREIIKVGGIEKAFERFGRRLLRFCVSRVLGGGMSWKLNVGV